MRFDYQPTTTVADAVALGARHTSDRTHPSGVDFIAGGTDLIQLLQEHVHDEPAVVDVTTLPGLAAIEVGPGGARLGALARMATVAAHPGLQQRYPVVTQALLASASPQVRNLATLGGNLLQRTRCGYFRDAAVPCNKRDPGTGCPAITGRNRMHAVLGVSGACIAAYAGDLATALIVLDATLQIAGPGGTRTIALADLHLLPGSTPHIETQLHPGELITRIDIPPSRAAARSHYLKVRDRASFEWAVTSAAVAIELNDAGVVLDARVAVGGVATTPWRVPSVEAALRGRPLTTDLCRQVAAAAADGAVTHGANAFKTTLIPRTVARALAEAGGLR